MAAGGNASTAAKKWACSEGEATEGEVVGAAMASAASACCPAHPGVPLTHLWTTDSTVMCGECVQGGHSDHEAQLLASSSEFLQPRVCIPCLECLRGGMLVWVLCDAGV